MLVAEISKIVYRMSQTVAVEMNTAAESHLEHFCVCLAPDMDCDVSIVEALAFHK